MNYSNKNIGVIKNFIEVQIRPGEKYSFDVIQKRFNNFFSKDENKELRKFRLITEKVNNIYNYLNLNKNCEIPDHYIYELREFFSKYRELKLNKLPVIKQLENKSEKITTEDKFSKKIDNVSYYKEREEARKKSLEEFNKKFSNYKGSIRRITRSHDCQSYSRYSYKERSTRVLTRGNYRSPKVPVDEFGCVVVCNSDD